MQLTRSKAIAVHKGGAFTLSFLNIFLIEIWVSDLGEKNNSVKTFCNACSQHLCISMQFH